MSRYGRRLTKQQLIDAGITEITDDGRVFRNEVEIALGTNNAGYKFFMIYDRDENNNYIKIVPKNNKIPGHYVYKSRTICLHRAMWAWHYGECPEGLVVDHISNSHTKDEDYHLSNLQLLTPAANLEKERGVSNKMIKCKLNRPREYYEKKLNEYIAEYELAKEARDAELAHKLRGNISNTKARIRYWDAHKEEALKLCREREIRDVLNNIFGR